MEFTDMKLDADLALVKLGTRGLYQLCIFWMGNAVWLFAGLQIMMTAFVTSTPPYQCYAASSQNITISTQSINDSCLFNNTKTTCGDENTSLVYESDFGRTIASDWNLICDRAFLAELASSSFFFGFLIGSVLAPVCADQFGRRWPLLASLLGTAIFGSVISLAPNYEVFILLRITAGVFTAGVAVTGWVIACEAIAPVYRAYATLAQGIWWTCGYCSVGLIAYFLPNWRNIALATGLPCFLSFVYYWTLPESLHWYVAKNKNTEAKNWIERAAKFNKVTVNIEECYSKTEHKTLEKRSLWSIFKTPVLTVQMIIMAYVWCSNSFVYYGLSLFSTNLAGARHLNYVLSGLVELPAYVVLSFSMNYLGRRPTMFVFHMLAGISLIVLLFLPNDMRAFITAFWLLGKFSISITYMGAWLYGAEIFPTTARSTGVGICNVAARSGGIVAPFAKTVSKTSPVLPPIIFSCASLIAGVVVLILPETNKKCLPDDIDDIEPGPVLGCFDKKKSKRDEVAMEKLMQ